MSDAKGTWIPFSNELPPPPPLSDPAADLARLRAERDEAMRLLETFVNYCQTPRHRSEGMVREPRPKDIDAARAFLARIQKEANT